MNKIDICRVMPSKFWCHHRCCTINYDIIIRRHNVDVLVCSTPLLAPRIGLYTASLVSLTDVLIGWRASDCDAPTQLWRIQINTGNTAPSPTWRKQKAFPLPETVALWVFWKSREFPGFLRGLGQSYAHRHGTWNSLLMCENCLFDLHLWTHHVRND